MLNARAPEVRAHVRTECSSVRDLVTQATASSSQDRHRLNHREAERHFPKRFFCGGKRVDFDDFAVRTQEYGSVSSHGGEGGFRPGTLCGPASLRCCWVTVRRSLLTLAIMRLPRALTSSIFRITELAQDMHQQLGPWSRAVCGLVVFH